MKRLLLTLILLLGTNWLPIDCAVAQNLDGQYVENDPLLEQYGEYSFQAFKYFPSLPGIIKMAKPDFKAKNVGTSFLTAIFRQNNGKKWVILSGCTPHDCGGTVNVIAYDPEDVRAYVLAELGSDFESGNNKYEIYGNPPENIRDLLEYHYFNR